MTASNLDLFFDTFTNKDITLWQLIDFIARQDGNIVTAIENAAKETADGAGILAEFKQANPDTPAMDQLIQFLASYLERNGSQYAGQVRTLSMTFEELRRQSPAPSVEWKPLDHSGSRQIEQLCFKVGAQSKLLLTSSRTFDPDGQLGSTAAQDMMHLSLHGQLNAGADAAVPLNFGSLGISASGAAIGELTCHYLPRNDERFSEAATTLGKAIGNPFWLDYLHENLAVYGQHGLQGFSHSIDGSVDASVEVSLVKPIDLLNGTLPAVPSLKLNAKISRGGEIRVSTYKESLDEITVAVTRSDSQGHGYGFSLDITIDPSQLLSSAAEIVDAHLNEFNDLIQQFDEYLNPSEKLKEKISEVLDGYSEDPGFSTLEPLLQTSLGLSESSEASDDVIDGFAKMLATKVLQKTDNFTSEAGERAELAISELVTDYPVLAVAGIDGKLREALQSGLEKYDESLEEYVTNLTDGAKSKIKGEIASLNSGSGQLYGRIDDTAQDLLKPVKAVLDRYQSNLKKVVDALEKAAKSKLTARLYGEYQREQGSEVELKCRIKRTATKGQEVFEKIQKGHFDTILALLDPEVAAGYPNISVVTGELTRFARSSRKLGFDALFVDIELSNTSIMTAGVSISHDHKGQVSILSNSEYQHRMRFFGEQRMATFLSAYQLVAAKELKKLDAGFTLSHTDNDLEPKEAYRYFEALEEAGLVEPGSAKTAKQQVKRWVKSNNGQDVAAEIRLATPLTLRFVERLIQSDNDLLARAATEGYYTATDGKYMGDIAGALDMTGTVRLSEVGKALRDLDQRLAPQLMGSRGVEIENLMENYHSMIKSLIQFVESMRQIYTAPASWDIDDYLDEEERLNRSLRDWIRVNEALFGDRPSRRIVAFLVTLQRLSTYRSVEDGFNLSIQMTHKDRAGKSNILMLS